MPGGVNSPVRAFNAVGGDPIFIKSAKGSQITDVDGNHYTYFYSASNNPIYLQPRQFYGQGFGDGNYHVKMLSC